MKKKIIIFIGIVTALSIVITPVFAQDSRNIKSKIIYQFVDNIIDNGTEEVLGLEVMYLITYENQLLALSNFRNEYFKEFHFIQEKYNLPTLTEKSYLLYLNKFTDFMQEYYENEVANEKFYNFNNDEIDLFELDFLAFNDIFENKKDNEVIKELINKINFEQTTKKAFI